jgi:methionine synthase I (cobalamin-dependent)
METPTTTRALEFREQLAQRVVVADGAMGTMLYSRGVFINRCFDELNLSSPDLVRQIHQDYVKAGAEIVETNTYGASRLRLSAFGLGEKVRDINRAGVRIAREAAKEQAWVAGAVGPLGVRIEPLGPTSFAEARAAFREQTDALVEAGVDLLILETFANLDELREAAAAARESAGADMVIVAQVTIDDFGHLPARDGCNAGRRHRAKLLGGSQGDARNHRADDAAYRQASERHAQCRRSAARGRAQHLPVLAGIHGAIRTAYAVGGREDYRRMLRHHA